MDSMGPINNAIPEPSKPLSTGTWLHRKECVSLNRTRTKVGITGKNLEKWGLKLTSECPCDHTLQSITYIKESCKQGQDLQIQTYSSVVKPHWSGDSSGVIRYEDDERR